MTTPGPHDKPPSIPYASAAPPARRFSRLVFFCSAAVMACAAVVLLVVVPRFEMIFKDFKLELPWPTRMLLEASDLASGWGLLVFILLPVCLGLITPKLTRHRRTALPADAVRVLDRLVALLVVACFAFVLTLVTAVLVILPLLSLIEATSSSNGR